MVSITGLTAPLLLAAIVSVICTVVYGVCRPFLKNSDKRDLPVVEAEYAFVFFFVCFFFFMALSCFFYVVIHMYVADYSMVGIKQQFGDGTFAMSVTSLMLGLSIVKSVYFVVGVTPWPNKEEARKDEDYGVSEFTGLECLKAVRWCYDFEFLFLMQNCLYMLNLFSLWVALVYGVDNVWFLLLSYLLFCVVNDWEMMHYYTKMLKGRLPHSLDRRVNVFNVLLFVCGVMMFLSVLWLLCLYVFFSVGLFVIRYLIKNDKLFVRHNVKLGDAE